MNDSSYSMNSHSYLTGGQESAQLPAGLTAIAIGDSMGTDKYNSGAYNSNYNSKNNLYNNDSKNNISGDLDDIQDNEQKSEENPEELTKKKLRPTLSLEPVGMPGESDSEGQKSEPERVKRENMTRLDTEAQVLGDTMTELNKKESSACLCFGWRSRKTQYPPRRRKVRKSGPFIDNSNRNKKPSISLKKVDDSDNIETTKLKGTISLTLEDADSRVEPIEHGADIITIDADEDDIQATSVKIVKDEHLGGSMDDFGENPQKLRINHLCPMGKEIGRGATGQVIKALHMPMCDIYALKTTNFGQQNLMEAEMKMQFWIKENIPNSPQLLRFHECFLLDSSGELMIVMDLMDLGSLADYMITYSDKRFNLEQIRHICRETVLGMHALHQCTKPLCHRDIKPHNILITTNGYVKLADYGLVIQLKDKNQIIKDVQGTQKYFSPERHEASYGLKSDIWAFGITVYEIVTGNIISDTELDYFAIQSGKSNIPSLDPNKYDKDLCDFVSHCLELKPEYRYDTTQLLNQP
eukprot:UN25482